MAASFYRKSVRPLADHPMGGAWSVATLNYICRPWPQIVHRSCRSSLHLYLHPFILPECALFTMAEELPQEALVRVFHYLPIKQRSRFSCVCKAWRQASLVDAVQVKLQKQHVPSYLHVALPDGAAQLQAANCPMMSLARSADITWASSVTNQLLESM